MQTLEDGDNFEYQNKAWIREKLPCYETIWQKYIGHDGNGHPKLVIMKPDELSHRHRKFYQAHYSFAMAAHRIDQKAGKAEPLNDLRTGLPDYLAEYERLFLAFAYIGHVRDMFEIMDAALKAKGVICSPFQDFYVKRSNLLHGPRPPICIDEVSIKIPAIAGTNDNAKEWNSKGTWDGINTTDWIYICDYLQSATKELFCIIASQHDVVRKYAPIHFSCVQEVKSAPSTPGSGCNTRAVSASNVFKIPPSGVN